MDSLVSKQRDCNILFLRKTSVLVSVVSRIGGDGMFVEMSNVQVHS